MSSLLGEIGGFLIYAEMFPTQQNYVNPTCTGLGGDELSNMMDYQRTPTLISGHTCNILSLLLYFGCTINQSSTPFGYLLNLFVQSSSGSFCVLCVLIANEVH
jgi:hypothetical protein